MAIKFSHIKFKHSYKLISLFTKYIITEVTKSIWGKSWSKSSGAGKVFDPPHRHPTQPEVSWTRESPIGGSPFFRWRKLPQVRSTLVDHIVYPSALAVSPGSVGGFGGSGCGSARSCSAVKDILQGVRGNERIAGGARIRAMEARSFLGFGDLRVNAGAVAFEIRYPLPSRDGHDGGTVVVDEQFFLMLRLHCTSFWLGWRYFLIRVCRRTQDSDGDKQSYEK